MSCRLSVNTREFTLTDEHATEVSDHILEAIRDGGGYVRVAPVASPPADVLVTPATTVTFERITPIQPSTAPSEQIPALDWPDDYA